MPNDTVSNQKWRIRSKNSLFEQSERCYCDRSMNSHSNSICLLLPMANRMQRTGGGHQRVDARTQTKIEAGVAHRTVVQSAEEWRSSLSRRLAMRTSCSSEWGSTGCFLTKTKRRCRMSLPRLVETRGDVRDIISESDFIEEHRHLHHPPGKKQNNHLMSPEGCS